MSTYKPNKRKPYPGKKRGPKGKWDKVDPIKVAALAGKLGATDSELAAALGITPQSLKNWKKENEELFSTLKTEKAKADARVVKSLFERASGYTHKATKIVIVDGKIKKVPYTEVYPPDTTACIFWLKNRNPQQWRDKAEHSLSNPDGSAISGGTTVIAPTVVFIQPKKEELTDTAIDITGNNTIKQLPNGLPSGKGKH